MRRPSITLAGIFAGTVLSLSTAGVAFAAPATPPTVPTAPTTVLAGSSAESADPTAVAPGAPAAPVVHRATPAVRAQAVVAGEPWLGVGVGLVAIAATGATTFVVGQCRDWVRAGR